MSNIVYSIAINCTIIDEDSGANGPIEIKYKRKTKYIYRYFFRVLIRRLDSAIDNRFYDSMSFAVFTIYRTCRLK